MNITGTLHVKGDTKQVTQKFKKRDLVLETLDNPTYPQYPLLQLSQDKCSLLDEFSVGDNIQVHFNVRGREWTSPQGEVKYFTTLDVWKIDRVGAQEPEPEMDLNHNDDVDDDLPF